MTSSRARSICSATGVEAVLESDGLLVGMGVGAILRWLSRWLPGRWLKGEGTSQLPAEADATLSCCLKNSRGLSGRWAIMAAASSTSDSDFFM